MPDEQDKTLAAKLCNCAVEDIDHTNVNEDGVLVVYFVSGGKPRRFTQKQIDKALEPAPTTIVTDVHHCVQ